MIEREITPQLTIIEKPNLHIIEVGTMNANETAADTFELSWKERAYLDEYYPETEVPSDEVETDRFFVEELADIPSGIDIAVIGTGPTADDIILAAGKAGHIYAYDYLERNVSILEDWKMNGSASRNWNLYTKDILQHEGITDPTQNEIDTREREAREKLTLARVDLRKDDPLDLAGNPDSLPKSYPVVIMPYCADSATDDKEIWNQMMHNASKLVAPGGRMLIGSLADCQSYLVGGVPMPAANITASDMINRLKLDFTPIFSDTNNTDEIIVTSIEMPEHEILGYTGILLARANKPR